MSGFGEFIGMLYQSASETGRHAARWMVSSMANAATAVKAETNAAVETAESLAVTAVNDGTVAMDKAADKARAAFDAAGKIFSVTETARQTMTQCCGNSSSTKPALAQSMTQAQAQAFIDKFKATDIPFDFPLDCCYARARVMCDMMEKDGFASQKLWSQGQLAAKTAQGLQVTFPDETGQLKGVNWSYHVAPLVNVGPPGGTTEQHILDPSLSNKPLTVAEWKALCGAAAPAKIVDIVTPSNQDFPFDHRTVGKDFPVDAAEDSFIEHRRKRDDYRARESGF